MKPKMSKRHKKARIYFAREFKSHLLSFWSYVFSDECMFCDDSWKTNEKAIRRIDFPRRPVSPAQGVLHPPRLLILAGIKRGQTCRWIFIEGLMNSAKFVSVNGLSEFNEPLSFGKTIAFQEDVPCLLSRVVSEYADSEVLDSIWFPNKVRSTQLHPGNPDLNIIGNLFSVLEKDVEELPTHWRPKWSKGKWFSNEICRLCDGNYKGRTIDYQYKGIYIYIWIIAQFQMNSQLFCNLQI